MTRTEAQAEIARLDRLVQRGIASWNELSDYYAAAYSVLHDGE